MQTGNWVFISNEASQSEKAAYCVIQSHTGIVTQVTGGRPKARSCCQASRRKGARAAQDSGSESVLYVRETDVLIYHQQGLVWKLQTLG